MFQSFCRKTDFEFLQITWRLKGEGWLFEPLGLKIFVCPNSICDSFRLGLSRFSSSCYWKSQEVVGRIKQAFLCSSRLFIWSHHLKEWNLEILKRLWSNVFELVVEYIVHLFSQQSVYSSMFICFLHNYSCTFYDVII